VHEFYRNIVFTKSNYDIFLAFIPKIDHPQ
jgi:hypothetical protein